MLNFTNVNSTRVHSASLLVKNRKFVAICIIASLILLGSLVVLIQPTSAESLGATWSPGKPLTTAEELLSCVTNAGYIYCVGGLGTGPSSTNAVNFAPLTSSGSWATSTAYPTNIYGQSCVTSSGYIYCVGGHNSTSFTNAVRYAPINSSGVGSWSSTTSYPVSVAGESCVVNSGYIYCVGGGTSSVTSTTYYATINSTGVGTWNATSVYPTNIGQGSCVTNSGYIYCIGGRTASATSSTNATYYATLSSSGIGTWSPTTDYKTPIEYQSCVAYYGYVYCIGGYSTTNTNGVYYAPINASGIGTWSSTTPYPININFESCAVNSGFIYCVGGTQGSSITNSVYYDNTVNPTTTSVSCSQSIVDADSNATCTAVVTGPSPTGTVAWSSNGTGTFSPTNSCTLSSDNCSVTFTPTSNAGSPFNVEATYAGTLTNAGSNGSFTIAVNPALVAGAISPSAPSIDVGQSITLSANASGGNTSYSYQWYSSSSGNGSCSSASSIVGANTSSYLAAPNTSTSYCYIVTDGTGATVNSTFDNITVNSALTAPALTPASQIIDQGQTATVNSTAPTTGTATYSYQWLEEAPSASSFSSASDCAAPTTLTCSFTSSGSTTMGTYSFELQVTDSANTPTTVTSSPVNVTVNAAFVAGSPSPASTTIDNGQSINLTANASGGTAPYTYQWYTGASCNTVLTGATFSTYDASFNTTYSYLVNDSASTPNSLCSSSSATITVNPALVAPTINSSSTAVDQGQNLTISLNFSGGTPIYTCQWFIEAPGNTSFSTYGSASECSSPNSTTFVTSASTTIGTYHLMVQVTDSASASLNSSSLTINVNTPFSGSSVMITPSSVVADVSQNITLTVSWPNSGAAPYSVQLQTSTASNCGSPVNVGSPNTGINTNTTTFNISPSTDYYCATVTDSALESNSTLSGTLVVVNTALSSGAPSPSSATMDSGQTVTLAANPSGGTLPYSFQWYTGASCNTAINGAASSTFNASPTSNTTYSYMVSDGASTPVSLCSTSNSTFTVNPALVAAAITPSSPTINLTASITLTASASGGTTPYSYQWYTGASCNTVLTGANSSTYVATPTSTTTYSYKLTDSATTPNTKCSSGDTVTIILPLAAPTLSAPSSTVHRGQSIVIASTSMTTGVAPYNYQWFEQVPNGSSFTTITGAVSANYPFVTTSTTAMGNWSFELQVTDNHGTTVTTSPITINVGASLLIPAVTEGNITIFSTSDNQSYLLVMVNTTISNMHSAAFYEMVLPQYGYLANGTWGYLGYYQGSFGAVTGGQQGLSITVTVTFEGVSQTGVIQAPASGKTSALSLVFQAN